MFVTLFRKPLHGINSYLLNISFSINFFHILHNKKSLFMEGFELAYMLNNDDKFCISLVICIFSNPPL
jgi:hypothetical protein